MRNRLPDRKHRKEHLEFSCLYSQYLERSRYSKEDNRTPSGRGPERCQQTHEKYIGPYPAESNGAAQEAPKFCEELKLT